MAVAGTPAIAVSPPNAIKGCTNVAAASLLSPAAQMRDQRMPRREAFK
jgi:hypothetical protein